MVLLRKKLPQLALAVLFWQVLGLFFCGDIDCLLGEGDEICQTVLCSMLLSHGHSPIPFDSSQDDLCQCTCDLAIDLHPINLCPAVFVTASYSFVEPQSLFATPLRGIDHIPRA
jgi:hypothetical protein